MEIYMKKIMIAFVALAFASAFAFADTAAAPAATTAAAPAATAAAAPAVALTGTISKIVAANKAKATPEQIVIKGADGKEVTVDLDKASTLKGADGKAITAKALKAGAKVNATYTAGDKANVLVTLDITK
jgi:hypothetical protein